MQKLLITFGTRPLAQRITKSLKDSFDVLLSTSEEVPSFLQANFFKIPTGANPTYAHELLKICLDKHVKFLLPLGLSEIQALAETKVLFEEYGINVLCPDKNDLEELYILEKPSSMTDLLICLEGKSINSNQTIHSPISGLFAVSDEGEDLALCTI